MKWCATIVLVGVLIGRVCAYAPIALPAAPGLGRRPMFAPLLSSKTGICDGAIVGTAEGDSLEVVAAVCCILLETSLCLFTHSSSPSSMCKAGGCPAHGSRACIGPAVCTAQGSMGGRPKYGR